MSENKHEILSLRVKTLTGQEIPLIISKQETVLAMKLVLYISTKVPTANQKLILDGEEMKDDQYLFKFSWRETSQVYLILQK